MKTDYTLKGLPLELRDMIETAAGANFRSLNQEIVHRLTRSFEAEYAAVSKLHAAWVKEALASGPEEAYSEAKVEAAAQRGIRRARR